LRSTPSLFAPPSPSELGSPARVACVHATNNHMQNLGCLLVAVSCECKRYHQGNTHRSHQSWGTGSLDQARDANKLSHCEPQSQSCTHTALTTISCYLRFMRTFAADAVKRYFIQTSTQNVTIRFDLRTQPRIAANLRMRCRLQHHTTQNTHRKHHNAGHALLLFEEALADELRQRRDDAVVRHEQVIGVT